MSERKMVYTFSRREIFANFVNFAQIHEIKFSRNIWKALISENKSSPNTRRGLIKN